MVFNHAGPNTQINLQRTNGEHFSTRSSQSKSKICESLGGKLVRGNIPSEIGDTTPITIHDIVIMKEHWQK
jgi:hypothetical protein